MEEKDYNESKLKSISEKIYKLCQISKMLVVIYGILQLIILIALNNNVTLYYTENSRIIDKYLYKKFCDYGSMSEINMYFGTSIVSVILIFAILKFAEDVFERINITLRPFEEKNIKDMILIARLMITCSFAPSIAGSIFAIISASHYCENMQIKVSVELSVLFVGVIVYCIAEVFKYGYNLQNESDETI